MASFVVESHDLKRLVERWQDLVKRHQQPARGRFEYRPSVFAHLVEPEFRRIRWFYYCDNENGVTIRLYDSAFRNKHDEDFINKNDDCILRGYDLEDERGPLKTEMRIQFDSVNRGQLPGGDTQQVTRTKMFEELKYNNAAGIADSQPSSGDDSASDFPVPDISQAVRALLYQFRQVILYGPPGTGKTLHAQRVALALLRDVPSGSTSVAPKPDSFPTGGLTSDEVKQIEELQQKGRLGLVVFHPAYEYEQFVLGIAPSVRERTEQDRILNCPNCREPVDMHVLIGSQGLTYQVEPGIFWKMCQKASDGVAVLIIDEINRGNLPKLLGELVYALEYRDRTVTLPLEYKGSRELKVPSNLFIIGTMNSSDRSIGHIDVAVRRRFGLFHVEPEPAVVRKFWHDRDSSLGQSLVALMERLNAALDQKDPTGELRVGHAYFLANPDLSDKAELRNQVTRKWEHQVRQLLQEYDQLMNLGAGFFKQFPPRFEEAIRCP